MIFLVNEQALVLHVLPKHKTKRQFGDQYGYIDLFIKNIFRLHNPIQDKIT